MNSSRSKTYDVQQQTPQSTTRQLSHVAWALSDNAPPSPRASTTSSSVATSAAASPVASPSVGPASVSSSSASPLMAARRIPPLSPTPPKSPSSSLLSLLASGIKAQGEATLHKRRPRAIHTTKDRQQPPVSPTLRPMPFPGSSTSQTMAILNMPSSSFSTGAAAEPLKIVIDSTSHSSAPSLSPTPPKAGVVLDKTPSVKSTALKELEEKAPPAKKAQSSAVTSEIELSVGYSNRLRHAVSHEVIEHQKQEAEKKRKRIFSLSYHCSEYELEIDPKKKLRELKEERKARKEFEGARKKEKKEKRRKAIYTIGHPSSYLLAVPEQGKKAVTRKDERSAPPLREQPKQGKISKQKEVKIGSALEKRMWSKQRLAEAKLKSARYIAIKTKVLERTHLSAVAQTDTFTDPKKQGATTKLAEKTKSPAKEIADAIHAIDMGKKLNRKEDPADMGSYRFNSQFMRGPLAIYLVKKASKNESDYAHLDKTSREFLNSSRDCRTQAKALDSQPDVLHTNVLDEQIAELEQKAEADYQQGIHLHQQASETRQKAQTLFQKSEALLRKIKDPVGEEKAVLTFFQEKAENKQTSVALRKNNKKKRRSRPFMESIAESELELEPESDEPNRYSCCACVIS